MADHFKLTRRELIKISSALMACPELLPTQAAAPAGAQAAPVDLRCEYVVDPLGVDTAQPHLSWRLSDTRRGARQTHWRILAASTPRLLGENHGDLWDSGKIASPESMGVQYAGARLTPGTICWWKVMAWDRDGRGSEWSTPAQFSVGLLATSDWQARWIGMASADEMECPWLRKAFTLHQAPETALAHVGSIGYHELYVNGQKVGDRVLAPSVSDLRTRAHYVTYDVRPYIRAGQNSIAVWLAPGWAPFRDFNPPVDFHVAKAPLCIVQVECGVPGAPATRILSDDTWRCSLSTTRHLGKWQNSDFGGDLIDESRQAPGWNDIGLVDSAWEKATVYPVDLLLSPDLAEPNRRCETIPAVRVEQLTPGLVRITMARLFSGWIELKAKAKPGTPVILMASSHPDRECEFNQRDQYTPGPTGTGIFSNRFGYHEYHYVTVEGLADAPTLSDCVGYRISNDRKRIGTFDCSNPLLKKIYDATVNTYVNLSTGGMSVDCPHRERLGYGGDGHTSLELALDTFESAAFFSRWAQDWCDVQKPDGDIYHTAPTMGGGGGPAWSGFVIVMPWEAYLATGDRHILEKTYAAGQKWLSLLDAHVGPDGLLAPLPGGEWYFLGDWAGPYGSEPSNSPEALLFNNCYFLYVSGLAAKIAHILGRADDEQRHLARGPRLRDAINRQFFNPQTAAYLDTKETHCVMPLISGAVPANRLADVMGNLEHEILVAQKGHLATGLHGTYFMTKYLTEAGRSDLVYTYATQTTFPSYGNLLAQGLDTWPEYWRGADSLVHGCLNGIGGWFQRGLAGIRPDAASPGYRHIFIRPAIVGDLTWARCSHDSPYGRIVSHWRREGEALTLEVAIPPNATSTVYVPTSSPGSITESGRPAAHAPGVKYLGTEPGACILSVQAGNYRFEAPYSRRPA